MLGLAGAARTDGIAVGKIDRKEPMLLTLPTLVPLRPPREEEPTPNPAVTAPDTPDVLLDQADLLAVPV